MTILTIDDSEINNLLIQDMLEVEGYTVVSALSGTEALKIIPDLMPDLILLDVLMPIMSGFETLKHIKNNPSIKSIPVIILSSKHYLDDYDLIIKLGARDFLIKPISKEILINKILQITNEKINTNN